MNPRVKSVLATSDYKLHLEFINGEQGVYDCSPHLDFGVFKELKDLNYFKQARVLDGTVTWPHEQDICPDTLYLDSVKSTEQGATADTKKRRG
ncbi:MAG: DUF2442 domain-containing protein [Gammaproteobacteria bacterium]|nr:DUF2442 domain-containing protein [Gammaproteobacteria bacterium]